MPAVIKSGWSRLAMGFFFSVLAVAQAWAANGIVILDFGGNTHDEPQRVAAAHGRVYVEVFLGGPEFSCGLFGLNADGTLIPTFGTAGRLMTGKTGAQGCPSAVRPRADGSLHLIENVSDVYHLRLRDATGGLLSTSAPIFANVRDHAHVFDVQADGRFIIGGRALFMPAPNARWVFARLDAAGTRDTTLGVDGLLRVDTAVGGVHSLYSVANGKFLASGTLEDIQGTTANTLVMRFNGDGTPDASFGANGRVELPAGPGVLALDTTGRIYVPDDDGKVARLSAEGVLDGAYAGGASHATATIAGIAVDSQNRAVLFGNVNRAAGYVARLDAAGAADASFNGSGQVELAFPSAIGSAALGPFCFGTLQESGQPILACEVEGESDPGVPPVANVAIARVTDAGALDLTFGANQPDSDPFPDAFTFPDVTVPYGSANVVSQAVTITGIDDRTTISGAEYSIGCNGSFTTAVGPIALGQTVCVRRHASTQAGGSAETSLTVGGRRATFRVISSNSPADSVPDAFAFTAQNGVAPNTAVVSNVVTISGITGFATVTVDGGRFSLSCDSQSFRSTPLDVTNGTTLCVEQTSAATASTAKATRLTVGGVSADFTTTTAAAPSPPVQNPGNGGSNGGGGGGGAADWWTLIGSMLLLLVTRRRSRAY